jgi:ubiquinone/menaquinone biosynthesis C-methylase UbiE
MKKSLRYFIEQNIKYRPSFFAYIRSQEASLFYKTIPKMQHPILDVGCGDGFFARTVFGTQCIDVGLDVPTSRMRQAPQTRAYKKLISYEGVQMPFQSNTFKTIISNCVFEHIPHIEKSVAEMERVLKPGGLLVTSVMCNSWNDNLAGGTILGKKYVDWFNKVQEHNSLLSKSQWTTVFKKAGFEIIEATDYLFQKSAQATERHHFTSLLSLCTYKLFGVWNLFPHASKKKIDAIETLIKSDTYSPSACFFVLKKTRNK